MSEILKIVCSCCTKEKKVGDYYISHSPFHQGTGRLHVCKVCLLKNINDKKSLINTLRMIDKPFIDQLFLSSLEESNKTNKAVWSLYMKNVSMGQYKSFNWNDSEFEGHKKVTAQEVIDNENILSEIEEEIVTLDKDELRFLVNFWGKGFEVESYIWLQQEYEDFLNRYECDSKGMELLIKEICLQQLDIKNRRANGEKVDQQLKTLQDLLGSSNLKPVQETGANAVEQETFGTLIKKYENEKPIPEPDEKWKDVDKVSKYIRVFFLGHLTRMLGLKNEYEEEYWEEIDKLTVEEPVMDDEELDNGEL
ncbi:hypothetical protein CHH57_01630 [Niallia circulans]|uniref:Uncharacterized protein n=1 Tax=Niallia circulans TaxID=1397 RepID=A0AA91TW66_NIACI|nr:hypothetical protein [Niallia circulans]PAD85038.1 hypothetical protein CHH57_01630 [Niallia circulans]